MSEAQAPDWFVEPFFPDGSVDWPAARRWVGDMHTTLRQALGSEAWTDEMASWLGRLSHDALQFQGVMLTQATADDLDDLLFTLLPARKDDLPGSPQAAVGALRALFLYGAHEAGAMQAADAVAWLEVDERSDQLAEALGLQASLPQRRSTPRKRLPRRRKKTRRRNKK